MVWRQLRQSRLRSVLPGLTGSVSLGSGQGAGRGTHRITPTAQSFPQTMIFHRRRRWQTRMRYSPFTPRGLFSTSMWSRSLRIGERQGRWSFMGSRSIRFLTVRCRPFIRSASPAVTCPADRRCVPNAAPKQISTAGSPDITGRSMTGMTAKPRNLGTGSCTGSDINPETGSGTGSETGKLVSGQQRLYNVY